MGSDKVIRVVTYVCSLCGLDYETWDEAEECYEDCLVERVPRL